MKPNESEVRFRSTLQGNEVRLRVDSTNMAHILGILTDMYSDKHTAILREYATNGRDAQIENGNGDRPIEVTIAMGRFDTPAVKIRDFGVGLTAKDIEDIYASYGASTKRDSNAYNGMLGIGAKSALTYTTQFTVTSIKDGVKIHVAVTRDAQGGAMNILATEPTTEPSGTEITVPIRPNDNHVFLQKARALYRLWPKGSVLLNGDIVTHWTDEDAGNYLQLSDNLYVVDAPKHRVVMGNVPYPVDLPNVNLAHGKALLAFVPIGTVDFQPSREMLMETDVTNRAVESLTKDFEEAARKAVQKAIDAATTPAEAVQKSIQWRSTFPGLTNATYTYKGSDMPRTLLIGEEIKHPEVKHGADAATGRAAWIQPARTETVERVVVALDGYYSSRKVSYHSTHARLNIEAVTQCVWVKGWTNKGWTAVMRRKLDQWRNEQTTAGTCPKGRTYIFAPEGPPADVLKWMPKDSVIDWADINAVKLPEHVRDRYSMKRIPGSYAAYVEGVHKSEYPANDLQGVKHLFYYQGNTHQTSRYVNVITRSYPKAVIVCLPANRLDKFRRDFPKAKEVTAEIKGMVDKWKARVSREQLVAIAAQDAYGTAYLRDVDPAKLKDPLIVEAVRSVRLDVRHLREEIGVFEGLVGRVVDRATWKDPFDEYPLISHWEIQRHPEHCYAYLNAAYEQVVKPARDAKAAKV